MLPKCEMIDKQLHALDTRNVWPLTLFLGQFSGVFDPLPIVMTNEPQNNGQELFGYQRQRRFRTGRRLGALILHTLRYGGSRIQQRFALDA